VERVGRVRAPRVHLLAFAIGTFTHCSTRKDWIFFSLGEMSKDEILFAKLKSGKNSR
jgi:hypothetical protein